MKASQPSGLSTSANTDGCGQAARASLSTSQRNTRAPQAAKLSAMTRPIPAAPAVIATRSPSKRTVSGAVLPCIASSPPRPLPRETRARRAVPEPGASVVWSCRHRSGAPDDHGDHHLPCPVAARRRHRLEGHQDRAAGLGLDGGAVRRLHPAAATGAEPHHPLHRHHRAQDERAGGGARHPRAVGHHPRQRDRRRGRHRLLPRDGRGQGGLPGAEPDRRAGGAGHDQHPLGHRRDGPRRDLERARAHQLLPAGHPRRRHRPLGREGQPRRDPQGGAAGEPGARHEPPDDRRARAPRHGDEGRRRPRRRHPARRRREGGAGPRRRGPPAGGAPRRRGARAAGGGGGARDRDGGPGGGRRRARRRSATSSRTST